MQKRQLRPVVQLEEIEQVVPNTAGQYRRLPDNIPDGGYTRIHPSHVGNLRAERLRCFVRKAIVNVRFIREGIGLLDSIPLDPLRSFLSMYITVTFRRGSRSSSTWCWIDALATTMSASFAGSTSACVRAFYLGATTSGARNARSQSWVERLCLEYGSSLRSSLRRRGRWNVRSQT